MRSTVDFLKECMTDPALAKAGPIPIDAFSRAYCIVCANRECSRSALGSMSFDVRVANWHKDMFESVPRADESDKKFDALRNKKFLQVHADVPEITLQRPQRFEVVIEEQPAPATPASAPAPAPETPATSVPAPKTPATPQTAAGELENTPFAQGTVLPGEPARKDADEQDVIMNPGGTFTFGGSDG